MSELAPDTARLGRYELVAKLATGGMAEVFLAREHGLAGLERRVVIKRILPHLADDPDFVDMFLREARIIARLAHPNVVQIHELGEVEGQYFIALEYIRGVTLRELTGAAQARDTLLPPDAALSILVAACRGAHAAHILCNEDGAPLEIVHRDISPHNIMVTPSGDVKLLDFGIAKAAAGEEATVAGGLKGKYAYMSPEQCLHRPLDRRSDIFALGIILWELLTGQRLFARPSELETMQAIIREPHDSVYARRPELPLGIDRILDTALAKDPEDRFPDAEQMRLAIAALLRDARLLTGNDAIAPAVQTLADDLLSQRAPHAGPITLTHRTPARPHAPITATGADSDEPATVVARPEPDTPAPAPPEPDDSDDTTSEPEPTPTPDSDAHPRRLLVALALFLLIGGAIGLYAWLSGPENTDETDARTGPPIRVGWAPILDAELLLVEIEPLRGYLEDTLDRPIHFTVSDDYQTLADDLLSERIDFAVMPPLLYLRSHAREPRLKPLAVKEADGVTSSEGFLMVRRDAPYFSLQQLQGKTFCFTDANSTSGNFLPRDFLRRSGQDPATFIGRVHWSGDHLQALRDLVAGACDVAATYSGNVERAPAYDIPRSELRIIAVTGHIPQDVIVAGPNLADTSREALASALTTFDPAKVGMKTLGQERISGFQSPPDGLFDMLRAIVEAEPE